MGNYCARSERSQYEVKEKLYGYGMYSGEVNEVLIYLISEGFVNEERYAKAFVMDKLRINHWGVNKIKMGLSAKRISGPCMKIGLAQIEEEEYADILKGVLERKNNLITEKDEYKRKAKLINYGVGRGFEFGLVKELVGELNL